MRAEALAAHGADKVALNVRVAGLAAQEEHLTQTVATLSGLLFGDQREEEPGQQPAAARTATKGTGGRRRAGAAEGLERSRRRSYAHLETEERNNDVERGCGGAGLRHGLESWDEERSS